MADSFSGVTASLDKASYNAGETMTLTIAGDAVMTQTVAQALSGSISLVTADGSTTTISLPAATVNVTTSTNESVKMNGISDTQSASRVWTIAASGITATATA